MKELLLDCDNDGHSALDWAADIGSLNIVEYLIRRGLSPYHLDCNRRGPLYWATIRGHSEIISYFVRIGCDPYILDIQGISPFLLAFFSRDDDLLRSVTQKPYFYPIKKQLLSQQATTKSVNISKSPFLSTLLVNDPNLRICSSYLHDDLDYNSFLRKYQALYNTLNQFSGGGSIGTDSFKSKFENSLNEKFSGADSRMKPNDPYAKSSISNITRAVGYMNAVAVNTHDHVKKAIRLLFTHSNTDEDFEEKANNLENIKIGIDVDNLYEISSHVGLDGSILSTRLGSVDEMRYNSIDRSMDSNVDLNFRSPLNNLHQESQAMNDSDLRIMPGNVIYQPFNNDSIIQHGIVLSDISDSITTASINECQDDDDSEKSLNRDIVDHINNGVYSNISNRLADDEAISNDQNTRHDNGYDAKIKETDTMTDDLENHPPLFCITSKNKRSNAIYNRLDPPRLHYTFVYTCAVTIVFISSIFLSYWIWSLSVFWVSFLFRLDLLLLCVFS